MPIYILEIPGSDFTGYRGGVDFSHGKGSTSSKADADRLVVKAGCRIVEPASEIKVEGTSAEVPLAIPALTMAEIEAKAREKETASQIFVNKKDRELHEGLVRRLGGDETGASVRKRGRKK